MKKQFICLFTERYSHIQIGDKRQKNSGRGRLLADEGQRFRDITQGKDGALYAVTDQGRLYRIGK